MLRSMLPRFERSLHRCDATAAARVTALLYDQVHKISERHAYVKQS